MVVVVGVYLFNCSGQTPLALGYIIPLFAMSHSVDWATIGKSSSRLIKLGDVKIMWGKTTVAMNGTGANSFGASTVTLPESFGNDGYSAVASPQDPGISNAVKCTVQLVTKTNFQITVGTAAGVSTASVPVRWIAIG